MSTKQTARSASPAPRSARQLQRDARAHPERPVRSRRRFATPVGIEGALRIVPGQVEWLEERIDHLNAALDPLTSFILPAGEPAAAALHLARAVVRRAERTAVGRRRTGGASPRSPCVSQSSVRSPLRRRARDEPKRGGRRSMGARRIALT
jgi:hypothetical protein